MLATEKERAVAARLHCTRYDENACLNSDGIWCRLRSKVLHGTGTASWGVLKQGGSMNKFRPPLKTPLLLVGCSQPG